MRRRALSLDVVVVRIELRSGKPSTHIVHDAHERDVRLVVSAVHVLAVPAVRQVKTRLETGLAVRAEHLSVL